jgi:hypothetical protein
VKVTMDGMDSLPFSEKSLITGCNQDVAHTGFIILTDRIDNETRRVQERKFSWFRNRGAGRWGWKQEPHLVGQD